MFLSSNKFEFGILFIFISQIVVILLVIGSVTIRTDVHLQNPKDRDLFVFDECSNKWVNRSFTEEGLELVGHTHILSEITDLITTTELPEGRNLYYTEYRVSANPSVVANTAKVSADVSVNTHSDVDIADVTDSELLSYDASSGIWINQTVFEAGIASIGHTHFLSDITDLSSTTDLPEGTNLYYTEPDVVANSAVVANTAKTSASGPINELVDVFSSSSPQHGNLLSIDGETNFWKDVTVSVARLVLTSHTHLEMETNVFTNTGPFISVPDPQGVYTNIMGGTTTGSPIIAANNLRPGSKITIRSAGVFDRQLDSSEIVFSTFNNTFQTTALGVCEKYTLPGSLPSCPPSYFGLFYYEFTIIFSVQDMLQSGTGLNWTTVNYRIEISSQASGSVEPPKMRSEIVYLDLTIPNNFGLKYDSGGGLSVVSNQTSVHRTN
jgi:hypothetical protein